MLLGPSSVWSESSSSRTENFEYESSIEYSQGPADKPLRQVIGDHARPPTKPTCKPFYEQLVKSGAIGVELQTFLHGARVQSVQTCMSTYTITLAKNRF